MLGFERLTRRDLGRLAFASLTSASARAAPKRIVSARLAKPIRYPQSHGDLWTTTWADDDEVYAVSDDTQGFDGACSSNLALNRIRGALPPDVHGQTVNPMSQFGGWGEIRKEDGAMWKACGLASIDGALYMTVSRHLNPDYAPWIQQTWDASIIRSIDHAKTWTPAPQLDHAMFPGRMFSTPFFVMYGKDGSGMGDYVYAVSNDGAWNNGNWMTMGRVRLDRIARLNSADWEFVHNYEKTGAPIWGPRADSAVHIFRNPGRTSMTGIHHIAPLDLYIMPQWHYTHLDDDQRRWKATCLEFYEAPEPWGPWSLFHAQHFEPEGWYNPSIPAKYINENGTRLWIFLAGDWTTANVKTAYYGLWMMEMNVEIG